MPMEIIADSGRMLTRRHGGNESDTGHQNTTAQLGTELMLSALGKRIF